MIVIIHNQTYPYTGIKYYHKRFLQKLSTSNDTYGLIALLGYLKQKNNTSTYDPQPSWSIVAANEDLYKEHWLHPKIMQDAKKLVKKARRSTSYHLPSLASEDFCDDGGDSLVLVQLFFSGAPQRNGFPS